jgi:PRTRC genetic system protein C
MARVFIVDEREHPDPDPNRSIEQVRDLLADFFPDLANATHTVTQRGEDQVVEFRRTVGTKGAAREAFPCTVQLRRAARRR